MGTIIGNTNIDFAEIKNLLGENSYDLGILCKSPNIDEFSPKKPGSMSINSQSILQYNKPVGGIADPYMVYDFKGYHHGIKRSTISPSVINEDKTPGTNQDFWIYFNSGEVDYRYFVAGKVVTHIIFEIDGVQYSTLYTGITPPAQPNPLTGTMETSADYRLKALFQIPAVEYYTKTVDVWLGRIVNGVTVKDYKFPNTEFNKNTFTLINDVRVFLDVVDGPFLFPMPNTTHPMSRRFINNGNAVTGDFYVDYRYTPTGQSAQVTVTSSSVTQSIIAGETKFIQFGSFPGGLASQDASKQMYLRYLLNRNGTVSLLRTELKNFGVF